MASPESAEASAWVAPAVGLAWGLGVQHSPLGVAPVADLFTVNLRVPVGRHDGLSLQLDPVELWTSRAWTREPRLGLSAWVDHPVPLGGRWAVVPALGVDGAVGVRTGLDDGGTLVRSEIGAVGALGRVAARRASPRGTSTSIALRGTAGVGFYDDGAWLRGTVEVEHDWSWGGR